ncbi:mariner transposase [Lasius niger]|uniref:Mariner transposase n=1 Tax=Lasius niger TaxID=67767 RepID=A0A0J7KB36_LASNI|nr:mariner transposase [Lasius niger]
MEKDEFRAVIKHFYLKKWTAAQIKAELHEVHGDSAPALKTVYFWINEFKRGRTSTKDEARPGRPVEATTPEVIKKIHRIVMEDRRMKVRDIAEIVGISVGGVYNILHEKLEMKKLCARWVPRLLTIDQKRTRKDISEQCLSMLKRNAKDFWRRFVTVDETWIHHYTPESKQQSKQWTVSGESAPKKAKTVLSAGKVMATVFWDSQGIILIDYLQKGQSITGAYYATLLNRLDEELRTKRPRLMKKKLLFHQDNAPAHTSVVAMAKVHELGYELLPHPPYSPDLAPCDFFLFPNLKIWLGGKRFSSNEKAIAAVDEYFQGFETSYFSEGIKKLEHRWTKCVELEGDYVEK